MENSFAPVAYQSSLAVAAVLFGVFGFLYTIRAMYITIATPKAPVPPRIVEVLTGFCKTIAVISAVDLLLALAALFLIKLSWPYEGLLAFGLVITSAIPAAVTLIIAFKHTS